MKQKAKKIVSYVYLVLSIWAILFLLFGTIYFYKQVEQSKIKYEEYLSRYSDLNKKYEDCMSDNICVCVCPIDPNEFCTGPITWCGPDKIGQWIIIDGKCQWVCCGIIYDAYNS